MAANILMWLARRQCIKTEQELRNLFTEIATKMLMNLNLLNEREIIFVDNGHLLHNCLQPQFSKALKKTVERELSTYMV